MLNLEVAPVLGSFQTRVEGFGLKNKTAYLTDFAPKPDNFDKRPILFPVLKNLEPSFLPQELQQSLQTVIDIHQAEMTAQDVQVLLHWVVQLYQIYETVIRPRYHYPETSFIAGVRAFITHPDHGIYHSLLVYRGMQHLLQFEPLGNLDDNVMQMVSVLHDFTQGFDQLDMITGKSLDIDARAKHGQAIGLLFKSFGQMLGFSHDQVSEIYWALRDHDNGYNRRDMADGRYKLLAALLHDADKLFGATRNYDDLRGIVEQIIRRNYEGNIGIKGSYLFRDDLDWEYRRRFTYGDRGFNDCLTVVLFELFGMPHFSAGGREIAKRLRPLVRDVLLDVYSELFDQHQVTMNNWSELGSKIELFGLSNQDNTPTEAHIFLERSEIGPDSKFSLDDLTEIIYQTPLALASRYHRKAYKPNEARGWKMKLHFHSGEARTVDPSVLRYCMKAEGKNQFIQILRVILSSANEQLQTQRERYEVSSKY